MNGAKPSRHSTDAERHSARGPAHLGRSLLTRTLRSYRMGRFLIGGIQVMTDILISPQYALLLVALFAMRSRRSDRHRHVEFVFYPRTPHHRYMIWKVLRYMGARISLYQERMWRSSNPINVVWADDTFVHSSIVNILRAGGPGTALNSRILDVSKRHVEAVSLEVFGYGLAVDPTQYDGLCVEKSNLNGRHDGRIIRCPVGRAEPGMVYQLLIDNTVGGQLVQDIRLPIILGEIPFAYLKQREIQTRFSNINKSVSIEATGNILSGGEMAKVQQFCQRIGLDFGELDLLRDNVSGRVYIIDVNKTPYGPPNHLGVRECLWAVRRYSDIFQSKF
jgi:hypothetical protein